MVRWNCRASEKKVEISRKFITGLPGGTPLTNAEISNNTRTPVEFFSTDPSVLTKLYRAYSSKKPGLRTRLVLGTALAAIVFGSGDRPAYAGICVLTGPGDTYECSGAANAFSDQINGGSSSPSNMSSGFALTFNTTAGFGLNNAGGLRAAFNMEGTDGLTFTDSHLSAITGSGSGLKGGNSNSGDLIITTTGTVTGTVNAGINFTNNAGTASLAITAATVNGGDDGIIAQSSGTGSVNVTVSASVTGTTGDGINANNSADGTNVTINAPNATAITGGDNGIIAQNSGTGSVNVYTENATVTGSTGDGINANNSANGNGLNVNVGSVSGGARGIVTTHNGSGMGSITVSGTVTGGTGNGIGIGGSGTTNLTLNSGAAVSTTSGDFAIRSFAGDSTTTVNTGASVTGDISLGGGTDDVIFDGGDFSGVTTINGGGGDDIDSLTFRNGTAAVAGSQMLSIENLVIGSGGDVSLSGTVDANTLKIESGGKIGGIATVNADVTVEAGGMVGPGNSPGLMQVLGDVTYMSGSTLALELGGLAFGTGYDRVDVTDDVATTGTVEGTATIEAGTNFDIDYFGAFTAGLGDEFDVLVADDIDSALLSTMLFDFSGAALGSGLSWGFNIVDFGSGREALRLSVVEQQFAGVPAPGMALLFGLGLAGIGYARRKRAA
jgi:hypothetical protein